VVENWLADFEQALPAPNDADLRALFRPDCHWRDVLALTWTIQTLGGRDAVVSALKQWAAGARHRRRRPAPCCPAAITQNEGLVEAI
jgi:putative flavoprotein involved in K+ transport